MHLAVVENDVDVVKCVLSLGLGVDAKNKLGYTALHIAFQNYPDSLSIIELLIASKADVNIPHANNVYVLHLAANEDLKIVKLLVSAGALVDVEGPETGLTPLFVAAFGDRTDIVEFLMPKMTCVEDTLRYAALATQAEEIWTLDAGKLEWEREPESLYLVADRIRLIVEGVSPNTRFYDGKTLLHVFIETQIGEMVELLLEQGADIELADMENRTAVLLACQFDSEEILEFILAKQPNLEHIDRLNMNVLASALSYETRFSSKPHRLAIVRRLLEIPLVVTKYCDSSCLFLALDRDEPDLIDLILSHLDSHVLKEVISFLSLCVLF